MKSINIFVILMSIFCFNALNAQCLTDAHSNVWNDGWVSCQTSPNPNTVRGTGHWLLYDLGDPYFLDDTQIWNANEAGNTDRGMQDVVIDYSMNGNTWIELGTYQLAEAPGTNDYMGVVGPDFAGIKAQYVLVTVLTTWGDPCAGLAEIKFGVAETMRSEVNLTTILQGTYDISLGNMRTSMGSLIPLSQPYNVAPYNYAGTELLASVPANMVDWVLVEVREGTPNQSVSRGTRTIDTQAAILQNDGSIVAYDGTPLAFDLVVGASYHFCVRHRNHLDVMTATDLTTQATMTYDFTTGLTQAFGTEQLTMLSTGQYAMFSGDFTMDGIIQTTDFDLWKLEPALIDVYLSTDGNLDGVVQVTDFDSWFPNKAKLGSVEVGF